MFVPIFNTSISASWLILAIIVIRFVFKKMPKAVTCVLWGLVAIRLICPFSIESPLSLVPSAETIPEEVLYMEGVQQHDPVEFNGIEAPVVQDAVGEVVGTKVSLVQTFDVKGSLVWLAGMAVMLLYALISYLRLRYRVMVSINERDNIWLCDQIDSPFILGMFRPRIYMPSGMAEEQAAYVIAHEQAHLQRHDHWWKPFGFLLLAVYWFNPLIWVAYILLSRDIELACDEKVIQSMETPDKQAYSEALLVCSVNRRMIAACPLAFGEVGVKARVKSVLNYKKPAFWVVVGSVVICAVVAVCFLTDPEESDTEEMLETACEHVPGDFVSYEWRDAPNPDPMKYTISEKKWDKYICTQCGEEFEIESADRLIPGDKKEYPVTTFLSEEDFEDPVATAEKLLSRAFSFDPDAYTPTVSQNGDFYNITFDGEHLYVVELTPILPYPQTLYEFRRVPPGGYGEVEILAEGELVDIAEDILWSAYALKGEGAQIEVVQGEDKLCVQFVFSDTAIFHVRIHTGDLKPSGILFFNNLETAQQAMEQDSIFRTEETQDEGQAEEPEPERVEPVEHAQDILDLAVWTVSNSLNRYYYDFIPNTRALDIISVEVDSAESARAAFSYFERKDELAITDPKVASQMIAVKVVYHVDWFLNTESNRADAGVHAEYRYLIPHPHVADRWAVHDTVSIPAPQDLELPQTAPAESYTPIVLQAYGTSDSEAAAQLNAETAVGKINVPTLASIYRRTGENPAHFLVTKDGRAGELPQPYSDADLKRAKVKNTHLDLNYHIYYYEAEVTEQVVDSDTGKVLAEAGTYRYFVDMVGFRYLTLFVPDESAQSGGSV